MPTITASNITITSAASGLSGYYIIGDEITVRWDNSSSSPGDNNSNLSTVTANFSEFGGGESVAMTETPALSGIYTATYTIVSGSIDATNLNVFITATDNNSTVTTESIVNLSLDNSLPTASFRLSSLSDTGSSNSDNITNKTTGLEFSGTSNASNVELFENSGSKGNYTFSGGVWKITDVSLGAGSHTITTQATDHRGNVLASDLTIDIDTTPPNATSTTPDLKTNNDFGLSNTDNLTNQTNLTFTGTAEANSKIGLYNGSTLLKQGTVDSSGGWELVVSSFPVNTTTSITASTIDVAGNISAALGALSVTVDIIDPTLTNFTTFIDKTAENTEVELTFAELNAQGDESLDTSAYIVQDVPSTSGTLEIGTDASSASDYDSSTNNIIDATHHAYWTPVTSSSGTLNAFTVKAMDAAGNLSSGNVQAQVEVNDPPTVLSTPDSITVIEDTESNINLSAVSFADTNDDDLTVTLTASAGTFSTPVDDSGVTETGGATVITLVGSATDINTYLDTATNIKYTGAANASGNSAATITLSASDGIDSLASDPVVNINITGVNDAPTATNLSIGEAYTEDSLLNLTDIVVTDVDTASITAILTLLNTAAGSLNTATSNAVTSTYIANTGIWTAVGAVADVNTVLAGLTFTPANNFNDNFTVTTSISDGEASAITGSKSFTGTAVNDAPTATNLSTGEAYTEDIPLNLTDIVVTDVDTASITAILTLSNIAEGSLNTGTSNSVTSTFNTGVWTATGAVVDVNTLLAGLIFTPINNFNANFTVTTSISDGDASAITGSKSFTGTAINDASTATNLSAVEAYTEDSPLNLTDIVVTDIDTASITATLTLSNTGAGSLNTGTSNGVTSTFNAGVWTVAGAVADVNTLLAGLIFTPENDFNANFTITTSINDGNAITGSKIFTGTGTNDAPIITNNITTNVAENQTTVMTVTSTDAENDTVTYSLTGGADQSKFAIDTNSGALTFKTAPDFESPADNGTDNVYDVEVTATDSALTDVENITVTVTNVNESPTGVPTITGTVAKNSTLTAVTTNIADDDGLGTFSYQWQAGNTDISGATSATYTLTQAEVGKAIKVVVSYTDGGSTAEIVSSTATANVTSLNSVPTGVPTITGTAAQNSTLTAVTSNITDSDGLGTFSYQWQAGNTNISGATNSTYTLTPAEVGKTVNVIVSYTDGGSTAETVSSAATINVTPVNDAPVITSSATVNAAENQTTVITVTSSDVNNDKIIYSLTGGTDQNKFAINSTTGVLTFLVAPDFETPTDSGTDNLYNVQVTATDDGVGTLTDAKDIIILVTDVDDIATNPKPISVPVTPTIPTEHTESAIETTVDGVILKQSVTKFSGVNVLISTVDPVKNTRVESPSSANPNHADISLGIVNNGSGISVIVPTSIGFQAVGLESPQLQPVLKSNLITDIQSTFKTDSVNAMVGGNNFIANFTENHLFFEQKIVLTTDDRKSLDKSIIIDGKHKANSDNSVTNAIVVDATAIDSNTVLELKQISFAAITGGVSIIADDFNNTLIIGNNQTQQSVSTKGGDDLIHISKGSNLQKLHGGLGNDVTQFEGSINDYQIHQDFGRIILTSSSGASTVATLVGMETLNFADKTMTVEYENAFSISGVTGTYLQMFGRQPHVNGVKFWTDAIMNKGLAPGAMALAFMNSGEQLQKIGFDITQADIGTQVEQFYLSFFHRNVDEAGKDFWVNNLTAGTLTLEHLATEIILSPEMQAHYTAVSEWDFFV